MLVVGSLLRLPFHPMARILARIGLSVLALLPATVWGMVSANLFWVHRPASPAGFVATLVAAALPIWSPRGASWLRRLGAFTAAAAAGALVYPVAEAALVNLYAEGSVDQGTAAVMVGAAVPGGIVLAAAISWRLLRTRGMLRAHGCQRRQV